MTFTSSVWDLGNIVHPLNLVQGTLNGYFSLAPEAVVRNMGSEQVSPREFYVSQG